MGIISWIKLLGLALLQDGLIFKPSPSCVEPIKSPSIYKFSKAIEDKTITTEDNISLQIWQKIADDNKPTFIVFHGNTGNWTDVGEPEEGEDYDREYRIKLLQEIDSHDAGFIAVSMRGYGNSTGIPSEQGFQKDVAAIAKYISDNKISNVILIGESLGASVAFMLGKYLSDTNNPAKMIVAIAGFSSMSQRVIQDHPDLSEQHLKKFLKHNFDSINHISKLDKSTKLYITHGRDDSATLPYHSDLLAVAAQKNNLDVVIKKMDDTEHIDWNPSQIINDILDDVEL